MDILAALFVEEIGTRQVAGPSTRIDLTGVHFSFAAPNPPPVTIGPHLVVLVRCPKNESGQTVLEVVFRKEDGEQVARNVQPVNVEPGKFGRLLVRGELTFEDYGTIEAHCRLGDGPWLVVPLALLPGG
ncbi:MAG: hypothetical protein KY395_02490 [Actinobacteria bacterium]|nr:hypothetical protein [Actinomycetota bacterium]